MQDRINRKDDESLYQPKIHSKRIKSLYSIKQTTGKPMTVLLDQAISDLAEKYSVQYLDEEPNVRDLDEETWEEICDYRRFLDQLDYLKCLDELEEIKNSG